MRLSKHHHAQTIGFNITPMVDVVFLLIIFFMTVSQISRVNAHNIQLPLVNTTETETEMVSIGITIDADGNYFWSGESLTLLDIATRMQLMMQRVDGDPSRLNILVRCDHRTDSRHVNGLIAQLAVLGVSKIRTAVTTR